MLEKNKLKIILTAAFFAGFGITSVSAAQITEVDLVPSGHDFDEVNVDSSKDKEFAIENNSADPVNINIEVNGDTEFTLNENNCDTEVAAGDDCTIEVRFEPDDEETYEGEIELSIDEDPGDFEEYELNGEGVESEFEVDLSDDSISFDDTFVDYYSIAEVEVSNDGSSNFTIEDIALQGTDEAEFEFDDSDCIDEVLAAAESCTLLVFFMPDTAAAKSAELEITVEDDSEEYLIDLDGTGVAKDANLTVDPARKDLGTFERGEDETVVFTVSGDTTTTYEITNVRLTGSGDFEIDDDECDGVTLDDGTDTSGDVEDECNIDVYYDATEAGLVHAILEVEVAGGLEFNMPIWAFVEGADDYPSDVEGDTFETYIKRLIDEGVVSGYSDGTFKSGQEVTRGQLAKFIFNALEISTNTSCEKFPDVASGHTFYTEITSLKCEDIVSGYSDGEYKPENPVTRGEVTKFITQALDVKNITVDLDKTENFPDVDDTDKFLPYIAYLSSVTFEGQKIISGYTDGEFKSARLITRGEMSKMVDISMRYYENQ